MLPQARRARLRAPVRAAAADRHARATGGGDVDFGLTIFPTDYAIDPATLGRAAEEAGFSTLLFAEHTHIPVSRDTPPPAGGELPQRYWHTLDPFVACAAVATATTSLRMG